MLSDSPFKNNYFDVYFIKIGWLMRKLLKINTLVKWARQGGHPASWFYQFRPKVIFSHIFVIPERISMKYALKLIADYNLDWTNLSCLTVDGGKNMKGIKKGLVGQVKQMCNEKNISQPIFLHCIIHQQALCAKCVDISSVLIPVVKMVNIIRSHGLNHRQFRDMLKETDTESQDLPYYTAVRWLSCGKVLGRVFELRKHTLIRLQSPAVQVNIQSAVVINRHILGQVIFLFFIHWVWTTQCDMEVLWLPLF